MSRNNFITVCRAGYSVCHRDLSRMSRREGELAGNKGRGGRMAVGSGY